MNNKKNLNIVILNKTDVLINIEELSELYVNGNFQAISQIFIKLLSFLENYIFTSITTETKYFIDIFTENFLFYITKPDFEIDTKTTERFISLTPIIANIVALSSFRNTDSWINILIRQKENRFSVLKMLILYNSRNTIKLNREYFFVMEPNLASLWYGCYFNTAFSWQNKTIYENMIQHMEFWDQRMVLNSPVLSEGYMISSYISPEKDKIYKKNFNNIAKTFLKNVKIKNTPNKKKIAIISSCWRENHEVYRDYYKYIESLKDDYDLTLITSENTLFTETSFFKEVIHISLENIRQQNFFYISDNDFIMAFYIDIGMDTVSRFLSNLRIAPLQAVGYGHPVSTFSSEIDYFIGGSYSENIGKVKDYYSEKMLLIQGLGVYVKKPDYQVKNLPKLRSEFIINCPWTVQKINYSLIQTLKKILEKSEKKVIFRFFYSNPHKNYLFPFIKDLEEILNHENVHVLPFLGYEKYFEVLEEGDISLDAFPFGGINTVIDSIYLGKPIVTLKGWRFNNRAGSALLEKLGLQILVANNEDEYINKVIKLINDDLFRIDIQKKIKKLNLDVEFSKLNFKNSFKNAIDNLIAKYRK